MDIRITARIGDVTTAMKEKVEEKLGRLSRLSDRIGWIDVVLDEDSGKKTVEMNLGLTRGANIVGKAGHPDPWVAIDMAVEKVSRQLRKAKERRIEHRFRRPAPAAVGPVETMPSFEEAVRELQGG